MRVTCMWISHDVLDIMMSKLLDAGEREREEQLTCGTQVDKKRKGGNSDLEKGRKSIQFQTLQGMNGKAGVPGDFFYLFFSGVQRKP